MQLKVLINRRFESNLISNTIFYEHLLHFESIMVKLVL